MGKLYFVRHGQTFWNVETKICGATDIALTPLGHEQAVLTGIIDGSMQSKKGRQMRQDALNMMRDGSKNILFATYSLAREGIDIPRLDRLFLASPKKDCAVLEQSLGRISRSFPGKTDAICYDYVDRRIGICIGLYRHRYNTYLKMGLQCPFFLFLLHICQLNVITSHEGNIVLFPAIANECLTHLHGAGMLYRILILLHQIVISCNLLYRYPYFLHSHYALLIGCRITVFSFSGSTFLASLR